MVVEDAAGREVSRSRVPIGADALTWNGLDNTGNALPAGTYSFTLESYTNGVPLGTQMLETYSRISEVRVEEGVAVMVMKDGQRATIVDISGLREPA
jgi:flagellar basal-body rod modification protein FlgD